MREKRWKSSFLVQGEWRGGEGRKVDHCTLSWLCHFCFLFGKWKEMKFREIFLWFILFFWFLIFQWGQLVSFLSFFLSLTAKHMDGRVVPFRFFPSFFFMEISTLSKIVFVFFFWISTLSKISLVNHSVFFFLIGGLVKLSVSSLVLWDLRLAWFTVTFAVYFQFKLINFASLQSHRI